MIRNIYIPPQSSCQQTYFPPPNNIRDNLKNTSLIIGDFNAYHELWFSEANQDIRGTLLSETIAKKKL